MLLAKNSEGGGQALVNYEEMIFFFLRLVSFAWSLPLVNYITVAIVGYYCRNYSLFLFHFVVGSLIAIRNVLIQVNPKDVFERFIFRLKKFD